MQIQAWWSGLITKVFMWLACSLTFLGSDTQKPLVLNSMQRSHRKPPVWQSPWQPSWLLVTPHHAQSYWLASCPSPKMMRLRLTNTHPLTPQWSSTHCMLGSCHTSNQLILWPSDKRLSNASQCLTSYLHGQQHYWTWLALPYPLPNPLPMTLQPPLHCSQQQTIPTDSHPGPTHNACMPLDTQHHSQCKQHSMNQITALTTTTVILPAIFLNITGGRSIMFHTWQLTRNDQTADNWACYTHPSSICLCLHHDPSMSLLNPVPPPQHAQLCTIVTPDLNH